MTVVPCCCRLVWRGDATVLIYTARATPTDSFREFPVEGFIGKPCDKTERLGKIQVVLDKYKRVARKTLLIGDDDP